MSKGTSHKQARAGGKFCRVPDGYISKIAHKNICWDYFLSGEKGGLNLGYDIGFEKGKESGIMTGVFFGALGMFVVGVFMLYAAVFQTL